jgi:hypothetical protein
MAKAKKIRVITHPEFDVNAPDKFPLWTKVTSPKIIKKLAKEIAQAAGEAEAASGPQVSGLRLALLLIAQRTSIFEDAKLEPEMHPEKPKIGESKTNEKQEVKTVKTGNAVVKVRRKVIR